jgi:predicted glycoside hydrolase/deacetylase ChbG (UPF0249 family)
VILCADDYGLSAGVSKSIIELAAARRISATSAMVTLPRWPRDAADLKTVRDRISLGLHLNLTVGAPLGPMPRLAPANSFPAIGALTKASVLGKIDAAEVGAEIDRQLEAFEAAIGSPPDHIDGHQHVHALPGIRGPFLAAITRRWGGACLPLVRDPADSPGRIARRGKAIVKALGIAVLVAGFGAAVRRAGVPTNEGFSGFSEFKLGTSYRDELSAAMRGAGRRHLAMCHPGFADAELAALDPVTLRREEEHAALMADNSIVDRIWHADRANNGPPIDWARAF